MRGYFPIVGVGSQSLTFNSANDLLYVSSNYGFEGVIEENEN